ncbi:dicarboxylate/amino acid:cation symporter [Candidatus Berkiella cookevillensis]|uniref:Dicarboxylate/amino acid:cation symporter n=1 Tax=Candidatus Berkiella cookevillensis TaxID=437022 RepID=A0A0Q9YJS9_9GAMM|nr:cation:dicarboxylase symporter family transporter [Candidatus Berkiella cookevillensis]MCS5708430.1 dicarboxylate/amino acid:cation symporter [Candidatus Berkiella cookevillensis]
MRNLFSLFHKHFFVCLIISLILSLGLSYCLTPHALSNLLAISILIKEIIMFMMPLLIMGCAFQCMYHLKRGGILMICVGVVTICLSNALSAWIGYGVSHIVSTPALQQAYAEQTTLLLPAFSLVLPKWLANEWALMTGLLLGMLLSIKPSMLGAQLDNLSKSGIHLILNRILMPLLPIFISGYFIKMHQDGVLSTIFYTYAKLALMMMGIYLLYLFFTYYLTSGLRLKKTYIHIKNVLPAAWVGFSAMSSLAALPLNLQAAQKNTQDSKWVGGILPISTNIHLVGDSIGIPFLAMALLITYGHPLPDLYHYFIFSCFFVLSKFSVAAVPGGGILVMLPILMQYLGFNAEMCAFITALYVLLDPIITCVNVLGNGMLMLVLDKFHYLKESRKINEKFKAKQRLARLA